MATEVSVDVVMAELRARVRERLRQTLLHQGGSPALDDPALFADVARLLQAGVDAADAGALVLPELLGEPDTWRLELGLHNQSHRGPTGASFARWLKRRVLMPLFRWFFEYSRDNFERQQHVNHVLFAVVQELALENARLRQEMLDVAATRTPPRLQ